MVSQIKFNYVATIGSAMVALAFGIYFCVSAVSPESISLSFISSLFWLGFIGLIGGILGAITGGQDEWKCDYCYKRFVNKADCIGHEKSCKLNYSNKTHQTLKSDKYLLDRRVIIAIIIFLLVSFVIFFLLYVFLS